MLKLHAKKRKVHLSDEFYWICCFANCQHALAELEQTDYLQTPFAKALTSEKCEGTIILLDEGNATPFRRSWCVFESYISTVHCTKKTKPHLIDFATIVPEGECENSDDIAEEFEEYLVYGYNDLQLFNQRCAGLLYDKSEGNSFADRETEETTDHPGNVELAWIPADVSIMGFYVDISKAQATREVDKRCIDRWVGDDKDRVNKTLRLMFAGNAMYMAATEIGNLELVQEIMESPLITMDDARKIVDEFGIIHDTAEYFENIYDRKGKTCEHTPILRYLLEKGFNPDQRNEDGKLPLNTTFKYERYGHVRLLLEFGADVNLLDTDNIEDDCPKDIIQMLMDKGVDISL
jgi:hypothetical protein